MTRALFFATLRCRNGDSLHVDSSAGPILVIEDSPEIARLMAIVLREGGFSVWTAASHEEALTRPAMARPALVLLDVGLPPANDGALAAALRERYGRGLPVMLVSGVSEAALQSAVRRTGAVDAIRKPFDINDLLARVRCAVNRLAYSPADRVAVLPLAPAAFAIHG